MDKNKSNLAEIQEEGLTFSTFEADANATERMIEKEGSSLLSRLLKSKDKILLFASQEVVQSLPIITRQDKKNDAMVGVFRKGTINVIQGKTGTHKSRLAELFCSLLLKNIKCKNDFLGFIKTVDEIFSVIYIDTERNQKEAFPMTVQKIRDKAGFGTTKELENFYPFSIKEFSREERIIAVKESLKHVKSLSNRPLFVVLDVVTDCVKTFNSDSHTLELFDHLGNLCDDYEATFLLLIHENPGSDKARGHTGTEASHKADVVMQIGYEKEDSELMKIRFLKHRNAARPDSIYLKFSKEANGLVLANDSDVAQIQEQKKRSIDITVVKELLENFLVSEKPKKDVIDFLKKELECQERILGDKITELIAAETVFYDKDAKQCKLERYQVGRNAFFRLKSVIDNQLELIS